ncbi:MAG: hypothetical protein VCC00_11525 [Deltaproteobacteria bacterium]
MWRFSLSAAGLVGILSGFGIFVGIALGGKDAEEALRSFCLWGLGSVGLLSAFRHIFLAGAMREGHEAMGLGRATFFEWEAGSANLAFGSAALLTALGDWGVPAMSIVGISYSIYLLGAVLASAVVGWRAGTLRRAILFGLLTTALVAATLLRVLPALRADL